MVAHLIFSTDIISCRPYSVVLQAQQTPAGTEFSFIFCFRLTAAVSAIFEQPPLFPSDPPTSTTRARKRSPSATWT